MEKRKCKTLSLNTPRDIKTKLITKQNISSNNGPTNELTDTVKKRKVIGEAINENAILKICNGSNGVNGEVFLNDVPSQKSQDKQLITSIGFIKNCIYTKQ